MPQIFIATIIVCEKVVQIIPVCLFEAVLCSFPQPAKDCLITIAACLLCSAVRSLLASNKMPNTSSYPWQVVSSRYLLLWDKLLNCLWDGIWKELLARFDWWEFKAKFTLDVFWFLSWNRVISNFVYWKFRYVYCLVIGLFNGQFRFSENLMYENKFVKVTFAESLQWPVYNYLLCNKKDSCRLQLEQRHHTSQRPYCRHLTSTLDVACALVTQPCWWYRPPNVQARRLSLPSGIGTCIEQPAIICQECTIADDVPSRTEDSFFRRSLTMIRQLWLYCII